jgi:hypothetical protein
MCTLPARTISTCRCAPARGRPTPQPLPACPVPALHSHATMPSPRPGGRGPARAAGKLPAAPQSGSPPPPPPRERMVTRTRSSIQPPLTGGQWRAAAGWWVGGHLWARAPRRQPAPLRRPPGPKTPLLARLHCRLPRGEAPRSSHQLTFWASPCPDASPEAMAAGGSTPTLAGDSPPRPLPSQGPLSCSRCPRSDLHHAQTPAPLPPPPRAPAQSPAPLRLARARLLPCRSAVRPHIRECWGAGEGRGAGARLGTLPPPRKPPPPRRPAGP